ncbi:FISUMP domain-containing protein [Spirosoma endbachense]|nr:FISUMP domain-containing protein [Spirosoma endbachense]
MARTAKKKHSVKLPFFLLSLFTLAFSSCKKDQESQPNPQVTTVLISGKEYPTTTIGSQVWTITNYDGPGGLLYKSGSEKPEYGRYYTFDEARAVPIPSGWRLPTMQDYVTLAESQGVVFADHRATRQEAIKKLTSTTNWRTISGTNISGFNAHPAGYSFQNSAPLDGDISEFWVADGNTFSIQENASGKAHSILFYTTNSPDYRFNLRFVKNAK